MMSKTQRKQNQGNSQHSEKTTSGRIIIFHPFLFALYPVLALLAINIHEIELTNAYRSLAAIFAIAAILLFSLRLIFHDWQKASMLTSFFLILFFSYGHIYDSLKTWFPNHACLIRHRYLLPVFGLLALSLFIYVWKLLKETVTFNRTANFIAFILVIFPIFTIVKEELSSSSLFFSERQPALSVNKTPAIEGLDEYPDIYYIILDGYGRSDILRDLYQCDNSNFISSLQSLNFYIATQSTSNYNQTNLSIASTLNLGYVNYLTDVVGENNRSFDVPTEMIRHSEVRRLLRESGYDFINFPSNYYSTEISDADIYWTSGGQPVTSETHAMLYGWSLNNFESLLATTTIARAFIDFNLSDRNIFRDQIISLQYIRHINTIYHTLFSLDEVADLDGQFLIFAHVLAPHPPFVFETDGEWIIPNRPYSIFDGSHFEGSEEEYINGYCNQLKYINKLVLVSIDRILAKSDPEPIIIIQGDHGPGIHMDWDSPENSNLPERMGILNAYFLPGSHEDLLYPSITPVNSFRVILKHYFNYNIEIIEDMNYFSSKKFPYKFYDVTEKVQLP